MKRLFLLLAITILLGGCTSKEVNLTFKLAADNAGENYIDIQCDGASVTTETDQTNTPDISPELSLEGLGGL